jgi:hypothetical protein
VAQYLTELPPKELMEEKLHAAISIAKHRHAAQKQLMSDDYK